MIRLSKNKILLFGIILFSVVLHSIPLNILAEEEKSRIVKVAYPNFENFSEVHEDGTYSGYVYEYLMNIAQYTNWTYEFVTGSPEQLYEKFLVGEVDLMGGMLRIPEMEEYAYFPEDSCGYTYATLSVRKEDTRFTVGDYQSIDGKKIGVYRPAKQRIANLEKFCKGINIKPNLYAYDAEEDMTRALDNGEVDLLLGGDLSHLSGTRVIASFAKSPYYIAITKKNPDLLSDLNFAIMQIEIYNPGYSQTLYQKYFRFSITYNGGIWGKHACLGRVL